MDAKTWQIVKPWVADLVELPTAERADYLGRRCPDPILRERVLAMLEDQVSVSRIAAPAALKPGDRVGPYEIVKPIDGGGMGQVFLATDTKLKRQVAIKVLPPSLAADHDRVARFQREAEVLASLNHPHIASIYGVEDGDGVFAIVMEFVDGEDLAKRIARGAIPLDDVWPIARQIADALEAAHEQGIVHRDLKPANIMVRADGTVKLLDFGLAKAFDPTLPSSVDAMNSPTLTAHATQLGMILGTAAYMAPEQAKGRPVDKRADIWAFGVVLHEMLTSRRLFGAADVSETLAAVLKSDVNLTTLPIATPVRVRTLLRDCLIRDPKQRLRDIGEARRVLDVVMAGAPDDPAAARVVQSSSPLSRALPWALAAALTIVATWLWAPWRPEKLPDRPLMQLDVDLGSDVRLPSAANVITGPIVAISPDGERLVFISGPQARLFGRRLDQATAKELPSTTGADAAFFSPDGQWVGFHANGKFYKVSFDGGAVFPLGAESLKFFGASWAEDADSVFVSAGKSLVRLPAGRGSPTIVAPAANGDERLVSPHALPGGKALLFAACASESAESCNVEVLTLADGVRRVLIQGGQSPHYLPSSHTTGHLLYVNKETLFAIPFDLASLESYGTAVPVRDDVSSASLTGVSRFDVSRTGTLIYSSSHAPKAMMTVQWIDSSGKKEPVVSTPAAYGAPRPSVAPDGSSRIALTTYVEGGEDISVYDWKRDQLTLVASGGFNTAPVWSPDGQYIVFSRSERIFQTRADGASPPRLLVESENGIPASFASNGKRLAYFNAGKASHIWTVPLEQEVGYLKAGTPQPFLEGDSQGSRPSFSPDGRWLAYVSGKEGVYVRPFPPPAAGRETRFRVSDNDGTEPRWVGHELVYRTGDQLMRVSYSVKGDTFIPDKPRVWIAALSGGTAWDLAPDGRRAVVVIPEATAPREHEFVMLQNFADELRRRVPLAKQPRQ